MCKDFVIVAKSVCKPFVNVENEECVQSFVIVANEECV